MKMISRFAYWLKMLFPLGMIGSACLIAGTASWANDSVLINVKGSNASSAVLTLGSCTDSSGNYYVTGSFDGTADFGGGDISDLSTGASRGFFVAKYAPSGSLAWVKQLGSVKLSQASSYSDIGRGVVVDASGNVYVCGTFMSNSTTQGAFGTWDADPGSGTRNLQAVAGYDSGFVLKLNSSGDFQWAAGIATASPGIGPGLGGAANAMTIALNSDGTAVHIQGGYTNNGKITDGVDTVTALGPTTNSNHIYVAKFAASNGALAWHNTAEGLTGGSQPTVYGIITDTSGNVFATGSTGAQQFGTDTYSSGGTQNNGYLWKISSAGTHAWVRRVAEITGSTTSARRLTRDSDNNMYIVGAFQGNADLDPNPSQTSASTNSGSNDAFVLKVDSSGGLLWKYTSSGANNEIGEKVAVDEASSSVYVMGNFITSASFSGNSLTSAGGSDLFVLKLSTSGAFQWVKRLGASGNDIASDVSPLSGSRLKVTHQIFNTTNVDPGSGQLDATTAAAGVQALSGVTWTSAGALATASGASAPTLTATPTSASVTHNSATLGGNVTVTGGADVTARGVVYALTSANANPEIGGASVTVLTETGTFSTGAFTRSASSLTASSGYSFKAYATNSAGTSYSSVGTFTTSAAPAVAPTLATTPSSASVTYEAAILGGNVTATGGADVTARGVVYALTSANANPEIGGASVTVVPETGTFSTGTFTRNATSLTASSGYSFKAYATNSAGTSYSSLGTFTTGSAPAPAVVIQPTAVLGHSLLRSSDYTAEASINQAGLTATYTSGVTTLTSYTAQDPRQGFTTSSFEGFTATADGQVNALFDYDLGALYDLEKVLFWNTKNDDAARVVTFQVFVDASPAFGSAVNLGTFTAGSGSSSFPTPLEVFNLPAATSRYVRFRVLTNGGAAYSEFGEIAFAGRTSSSIPAVGVASLARNSAVNINGSPAIWTLYFQSAVTGVTASNFDLTGAGATGATVGTPTTNDSGQSWTIPVSVGGEGQLMLRLANATGLSAPISNTLPFNGQSYYVDTVPPVVTIQSGPSLLTNSTSASFTFSATDAGSGVEHYEAKLDNGNYEVVTSPKSYTGLTEGEHTVVIKAADNATNEGAESYTWAVDLTPPVVQSVTRLTPAGQNVSVAEVVFRVTYSEPVTLNAPQTARYAVVPVNGSTITADVTSVSGSGATRDVTVTITGGDGEFRLRVLN